jgi:arabinogalactan oligomer/maltooligosaccharide transport system permease protein
MIQIKSIRSHRMHRENLASAAWTPYIFIAPTFIVMALVVFYPLAFEVWLSFRNMSLYTLFNSKFIGLENYISIFTDKTFYTTFLRTVVWTVVNVFFHVSIGLWLAILLNRKLPGKAIFRVLLILPWAMPQYIAALTWRGMFQFEYGAVNNFLSVLGIAKLPWLSDPNWTFVAAIITNIWLGFPFMMMVSLGGLHAIPGELYEAADIDGATAWQKFRNVTLPLLKPVLVPATILGTVWTFNMLNVIYILTMNTSNEQTHILVTKVYRDAFDFYRYSRSAALAMVIFIILLIFSLVFLKYSRVSEEG